MKRRFAAITTALASSAVLAACQSTADDTEQATPQSMSSASQSTSSAHATSSADTQAPSTRTCETEPDAPAIAQAAESLSFRGWSWVPTGVGNYNECDELTWAGAEPDGMTTGSSPRITLLFHEGKYVGNATDCPLPVDPKSADGRSVVVAYPISPDHAGKSDVPAMAVPVTYTYQSGRVTSEGDIPQPLLSAAGCWQRKNDQMTSLGTPQANHVRNADLAAPRSRAKSGTRLWITAGICAAALLTGCSSEDPKPRNFTIPDGPDISFTVPEGWAAEELEATDSVILVPSGTDYSGSELVEVVNSFDISSDSDVDDILDAIDEVGGPIKAIHIGALDCDDIDSENIRKISGKRETINGWRTVESRMSGTTTEGDLAMSEFKAFPRATCTGTGLVVAATEVTTSDTAPTHTTESAKSILNDLRIVEE
ncbi:LppP/LprE family lipoprotein [Gordonia shandongensis]|uniref:LppP/LprE family lipoprotein n=1 Tax=Gordonia shandongensis TaxID=376351 RepID=UPI001469AF96|nr:LppP/LprE family lipoprotein [Gordonia shandongensis]